MSNRTEATRESLIAEYVKGKVPFRVWFYSGLSGSLIIIVENLARHDAILQGFFSLFFLNLVVTLPLFLAQAHFVGKTLQTNYKRTQSTLVSVLIIGWALTGAIIGIALGRIYPNGWNSGLSLMAGNYVVQCSAWIVISYLTTSRRLSPKTE